MRRFLLTVMAVATFGVISCGFGFSAQAKIPVFANQPPTDTSAGEDQSGFFSFESLQEILRVTIPDGGTVVLGGILASPDVYVWYLPDGGSVILQTIGAAQWTALIGNKLALMLEDGFSEDDLILLMSSARPINDADNRPPSFWSELIESLIR